MLAVDILLNMITGDNHILELRDEKLNVEKRSWKLWAQLLCSREKKTWGKNRLVRGDWNLERCSNPAQEDVFGFSFCDSKGCAPN